MCDILCLNHFGARNLPPVFCNISVTPYICHDGYCSSMYGNLIHGSKDYLAMTCATDSKCLGFRYSSKYGFGFLCETLEIKEGYDDWKICGFGE